MVFRVKGEMMEKKDNGKEKDQEPKHVQVRSSWTGQDCWICPKCNTQNVVYSPSCHSCGEFVIIDTG